MVLWTSGEHVAKTDVTDRSLRTLTAPARTAGLDTGSFQNFSTRPWFCAFKPPCEIHTRAHRAKRRRRTGCRRFLEYSKKHSCRLDFEEPQCLYLKSNNPRFHFWPYGFIGKTSQHTLLWLRPRPPTHACIKQETCRRNAWQPRKQAEMNTVKFFFISSHSPNVVFSQSCSHCYSNTPITAGIPLFFFQRFMRRLYSDTWNPDTGPSKESLLWTCTDWKKKDTGFFFTFRTTALRATWLT